MLRAFRRYLRFFLLCARHCFISFGFNHCLSQSRARSILRLEGVDRKNGEGGIDYLPHGFDALFHDDRHWRVNHCNTARIVGVFEFNKIRNCGLQWRRNALFAMCFPLVFFIFARTLFNFIWYFVTCC